MIRENDIIAMFRKAFPHSGIGDDTAVVRHGGGDLLLASDAVVEGVHFRLDTSTPGQAVQKAVTSNVSDIFAMGGSPERILLTAGLPEGATREDVEGIIEGASTACACYGIGLVGGDTVRSPGGYFFDVAITGVVPEGCAVMRTGAEKGDLIVVSGPLGGSLAGLRILESFLADKSCDGAPGLSGELCGKRFMKNSKAEVSQLLSASRKLSLSMDEDDFRSLVTEFGIAEESTPTLRMIAHHIVPFASGLDNLPGREDITSMIDISDGLARDLSTLCGESGTGAVIEMDKIPAAPEMNTIPGADVDFVDEMVLTSGEEYRLLFTLKSGCADRLPDDMALIGRMTSASDGIRLVSRDGTIGDIPFEGYEHSF
ncbi:MAG: thiamine-phosphate kinase [Bacteroidales bacterium]|nr:thiamine-phosphate kinase [Candidatus Latescibacterota bacterium]